MIKRMLDLAEAGAKSEPVMRLKMDALPTSEGVRSGENLRRDGERMGEAQHG